MGKVDYDSAHDHFTGQLISFLCFPGTSSIPENTDWFDGMLFPILRFEAEGLGGTFGSADQTSEDVRWQLAECRGVVPDKPFRWQRVQFNTVIQENFDLSVIEKFRLLMSSLQKGFEFLDGFLGATGFGNRRKIAVAYLIAFFDKMEMGKIEHHLLLSAD
jgi:hypothetical protein